MKIYLDYDDTLVDLIGPTLSWIGVQRGQSPCARSEMVTYDYLPRRYGDWVAEYWRKPHTYFTDIQPLDGAIEFVEDLKSKYGKHNIFIVTRAAFEIREEKAEHAEYYFGINPENVLFNWDKFMVTKNGILIDDYIENVLGHVSKNLLPGILFNYQNRNPWANTDIQSDWVRIASTYKDITSILGELHEDFRRCSGISTRL